MHSLSSTSDGSTPPPLPVFSPTGSGGRVRAIIGDRVAVVDCRTWPEFVNRTAVSGWGVAWQERLGASDIRLLRSCTGRAAPAPFVLVTADSADNLVKLKDVVISELVFVSDAWRGLLPALLRLRAAGLLARVAAAIEASETLDATTRRTLAQPLRSAIPIRTVTAWSASLGLKQPSSLWRRWRKTPLADAGVRLEDYLDWIDVVRCAASKTPWNTWRGVANANGVRSEWLVRACVRLTGQTPGRSEAASIIDRWLHDVVLLLTGRDAMIQQDTQ